MKAYTKIYLSAFGYDLSDPDQYIPSELSKAPAVDIAHIIGKGRGGPDRIENLMAMTRQEHHDTGDKNHLIFELLEIHEMFLQDNGIDYDFIWMYEMKRKYQPETINT